MQTFEIVSPVVSTPTLLPSMEDGYAAFLRVEPEIVALPSHEVGRITADVPRCCAIALGAAPAIDSLRPAMAASLPQHAVASAEKLTDYVFAAYYAHLMASPPARDVEAMQGRQEEASALREHMLIQARALSHKGLVDAATVAEIGAGNGYLDMANDLVALSLLFRTRWSAVKNKTTVEQAECERADELGREILGAVGARLQPSGEPTTVDQAIDRRARAFTLFARAYESCRRAVSFLRWNEDDADALVPSLFSRPRSSKAASETTARTEGPDASNGSESGVVPPL